MYKCTLFHSVTGNQWLKSKHYINYFIINRLHEIIPEHMNIQLQNTTWWNEIKPTLWHCLFPSIPSIHHNSIIRLSHGAPLHGTPNGTTRSSLCWTRTLPTACEAFSADCVIYKIIIKDISSRKSTYCFCFTKWPSIPSGHLFNNRSIVVSRLKLELNTLL